jgi:hypothetical protein
MELAPYPACAEQVVKASLGHYPQPFLISDNKRTGAKIKAGPEIRQTFFTLSTNPVQPAHSLLLLASCFPDAIGRGKPAYCLLLLASFFIPLMLKVLGNPLICKKIPDADQYKVPELCHGF